MLNDHPGLLKATKFVGQSQGKQEEDKGFTQKEQKKVSDSIHSTHEMEIYPAGLVDNSGFQRW